MNDQFDQCDARAPIGGGRCSQQVGHSGPHDSGDPGVDVPKVGYHGTKVEAAVRAVTAHRIKKVEESTGDAPGPNLRSLLEAETREWMQIVIPILCPEPDERGAEEAEAAP